MITIETKLSGDMVAGLDSLLADMGEKILRSGVYAGADLIRNQAIANAPEITGILKRNIIVKRKEEESDGAKQQTYLVTIRKGDVGGGDAFYGLWVENGHKFVGRKAKDTNWKTHRAIAEREYGTSNKGARPFMRPAWESLKGTVLNVMRERMAQRLAEMRGSK